MPQRFVLLVTFIIAAVGTLALFVGCGPTAARQENEKITARQVSDEETLSGTTATQSSNQRIEWAIALHGGAGKPPGDLAGEELSEYKREMTEAMRRALVLGRDVLAEGGTSLDAVEAVIRMLEDYPNFNAGKGAVYNIEGNFEMHASIMDGRTRDGGAVAAVDTIKNPISAARRVMSDTDYLILVGDGAERFAEEKGFEPVEPEYFRTELRYNNWLNARDADKNSQSTYGAEDTFNVGTVGCVALDKHGNLAAGTSTGGVAHKRHGRMGDSSIIGAGTYADNRTCAVSCTGRGEYFIRNSVAFHVSALMQYKEMPLDEAVQHVVDEVLKDGTGGLIAVDAKGNIAMHFNRDGMRRAAADSTGKFVVEYWE